MIPDELSNIFRHAFSTSNMPQGMYGSLYPQKGSDSSPHLILADFLQDRNDPRHSIVRGHLAHQAMEKKYGWVTSHWKLLGNPRDMYGGRAYTMPIHENLAAPGLRNAFTGTDGTSYTISAVYRRNRGKIDISPMLGWFVPPGIVGGSRGYHYATPMNAEQIKATLAPHLPEHMHREISQRIDATFHPTDPNEHSSHLHEGIVQTVGTRNPAGIATPKQTPYMMSMSAKLAASTGRDTPEWVPKETEGKEESTGWVPVDSSWIAGLKYTRDRGAEMTVKKGGKSYAYPGFNLSMFRRWVASRSKGKWWWRNVGHVTQMSIGISRYPKMLSPTKLSRFTGPVHPRFTAMADREPKMSPFSKISLPQLMEWFGTKWGKHVTPAHVSALSGWLPGTEMTVVPAGRGAISTLVHDTGIDVNNYKHNNKIDPFYSAYRTFSVAPQGGPELENEVFSLSAKPNNPFRGASSPGLLRQMRAAWEVGLPKISWFAAQDMGFNGGLHWPLIGADGFVPPSHVAKIPYDIRDRIGRATGGASHQGMLMSHLLSDPEGRDWYLAHPTAHDAWVDTHPGSYSRKTVERHVAENAARFGFPAPHPDESFSKVPAAPIKMWQRDLYHPMTEHLIATGSLHPDFHDEYFRI